MNSETVKKYAGWTVLEIMGHVRIAGMVTEETVAGVALLRVDVPEAAGHAAFTRYYHPNSLYSMCPVDEATARMVAEHNRHPPIQSWEIPRAKAEPERIAAGDGFDGDRFEDEDA